jgi:D-glycero-alpha-D-manno-heptose-7-phosphate kinase
MIISRTPFRISFFGGVSDHPKWYLENDGAVLSTTINHYCQISVRYLPPFFEHKHRIVWSQIENVQTVEQIQHPIVRETLKYLNIQEGLEIHHDGGLPARGGLGASSAFAVGLLNALYTLKNQEKSKMDLALEAIHIERDLVKTNCGDQDQIACARGGINLIQFSKDKPKIDSIPLDDTRVIQLQECLMLVFTGFQHDASKITESYNFNKKAELTAIHHLALHAYDVLEFGCIMEFGKLLDEEWQRKK